MRVDTESGAAAALWGEREWISHVNVSPVDGDIVVFCHEGSWHLVQRMWTLRASTGEVWPLVEQRRWLERSGHEFFTRTGRVVTQYSWRFHAEAGDWVPLDVFINPDGSGPQSFRYLYGRPSHIQIAGDETLGVGDHALPREGFSEGRNFIGSGRARDGHRAVPPRYVVADAALAPASRVQPRRPVRLFQQRPRRPVQRVPGAGERRLTRVLPPGLGDSALRRCGARKPLLQAGLALLAQVRSANETRADAPINPGSDIRSRPARSRAGHSGVIPHRGRRVRSDREKLSRASRFHHR